MLLPMMMTMTMMMMVVVVVVVVIMTMRTPARPAVTSRPAVRAAAEAEEPSRSKYRS